MKKFLIFSLLIFMSPIACFAGVGDTDNRYYVTDEMWATEPYKKFVLLTTETYIDKEIRDYKKDEEGNIIKTIEKIKIPIPGTCTGQYISPNLILSAGHCTENVKEVHYYMSNYKNETSDLELVETPYTDGEIEEIGDWAVWLVTNPRAYSDIYFDVKVLKETTDVMNAGFGWFRIVTDEELDIIREIFKEIKKEREDEITTLGGVRSEISKRLKEKNIEPLEELTNRLKASECKVVFEDCYKLLKDVEDKSKKLQKSDVNKKSIQSRLDKLQTKQDRLKVICNNQSLLDRAGTYPYVLATTCDSWAGNSGGGDISKDGQFLYGICSYGTEALRDRNNQNYIASSKQFDKRIQELIKIYDSKNSVEENITKIPENVFTKLSVGSKQTKSDLQRMSYRITDLVRETDDLDEMLVDFFPDEDTTNEELLMYLDKYVEYQVKSERLEELQKSYDEAKANEQSMANRMLTAATVAATGIGGMELAQGLAEQKADKEAESDMTAYISTMRCKYGNKSVKAGNEEIELPGGNDETMMKLRDEYFALSANLKERKEALGMKPGIESETILDKSQMGLYDDESVGITSGNYSSLYRAKILESESDKTQIDEAKETSKNRVISGGTAAGVGVVGGAVGDYLINGESNKQKGKK